MKLEEYRKKYYEASAKTSELVRQLGLAGIAVIWVFKADQGGKEILNPLLLRAGVFIVVALGLDLLHYIYRTLAWGLFTWSKERQGLTSDVILKAPRKVNWASIALFWGKIIAMLVAYYYLIRFLYERLL